jgi:hypothetical protein
MRLGFVLLLMASGTACIFDQSEYKGGGRLDKGATATVEPPPPVVPEAGPLQEAATLDEGG